MTKKTQVVQDFRVSKIVIDEEDPDQMTCGEGKCPFCEWMAAFSRPVAMRNPRNLNEFITAHIMGAVDRGCTLACDGGKTLVMIMDDEKYNATPYGVARTSLCKELLPPK